MFSLKFIRHFPSKLFRCFFCFLKVDEEGLPVSKPQLGCIMEERERASSIVSNSARDNDGTS